MLYDLTLEVDGINLDENYLLVTDKTSKEESYELYKEGQVFVNTYKHWLDSSEFEVEEIPGESLIKRLQYSQGF